ncbi:MAG: hypothetical protein KA314_20505 [Chloroflexi bacterium]|nr:hypothetical protein [Chloroflexota bacterium]MBP8058220.1 hypothetical protein [Chloroflexota bacterium]
MRKEMEVMRIFRVPPLGKIVVEVGSNRYLNLDEIPEPEAKRRVVAAIGDLLVFAGGYQRLVDADVAPPLPLNLAGANRGPLPPLPTTRDLAVTPPRIAAANEKSTAPVSRPVATGPLNEAASATMMNIAAQIDEILQRHIATIPALSSRVIHLKQSASGGLVIEVDGQSFKRPNEIDDKEVRDVIKRALKEWEKV